MCIEKFKGFLTQPTKTFKAEQKTKVGAALKYGLLGLVILSILTIVITLVFGSVTNLPFAVGTSAMVLIIAIIVVGFICLMLCSAWLHIWVYIFGGRNGIGNTVKTVFYAYTPVYVLGWIPIVNFFANIWYLVLTVIGLTQLQKLSTGKAIGAVVVAILIPIIIVVALIIWAISLMGPEFLSMIQQLSQIS